MSVAHLHFGHPREFSRVRRRLLSVGLHAMVAGMAASAVALASISGGTPAGSSDPESPGNRLIAAAFEAIYSETGEYRDPAVSQIPRVRLASVGTDFTTGTASAADEAQTTGAIPAKDRASFHDRFNSSFGERLLAFDERFANTPESDRPRALSAVELGRDSLAPPETPKRENPQLAMLSPAAKTPAVTPASVSLPPTRPTRAPDARGDPASSEPSPRTAIYDISARVVYLPNGEKLEAHSGLGEHMDDPRTVGLKNRGVTPPNVYELSLRERPFHGVRAIRLTPVDPDKMLGRDGMLAHSYLLGPSGQSNGCVSINDYPRFLNAFLNGEIDRLVVVERLADPPLPNFGIGWLAERFKALFKSS
jgi:Protein of unknown function (DUF2778)